MGEMLGVDPEPLLLDPEFPRNPYPAYAVLFGEHPVFRSDQLGYWFVSGYDEIKQILLDPARYSSTGWDELYLSQLPDGAAAELRHLHDHFSYPSLFASDPPVHTRLRRLVHRAFTPTAVERLRGAVEQTVNELLDGTGPDADLLRELAIPLPVTIFAQMFGIPRGSHAMLKKTSSDFTRFVSNVRPNEADAREADASLGEFRAFLRGIFAARRARPSDDLVTILVSPDEQGDVLSDEELLSICAHLLIAGHETTTNLIANGLFAFLTHPEQLMLFRAENGLLAGAVEEMLRWETPLQRVKRMTTCEVELVGHAIGRGERLMLLVGAGNRDPRAFETPETFDITARRKPHLSLGHGIHFCIGASLARLEGSVAVATVFDRYPNAALPDGWTPRWNPSLLRGLEELPVRLGPSR